jgi:hypothetical protein
MRLVLDDLEVKLTHARDDGLAGLVVEVRAERRVLATDRDERLGRASACRRLSSARSTCEITGSGNVIRSSTIGFSA